MIVMQESAPWAQRHIEETLRILKCPGRVVEVHEGPRLVRYGVEPRPGVRMRAIAQLGPDLARVLAVERVHIWAPLPGTTLVGIDVPRAEPERVTLGSVLRPTWSGDYPPLTLPLGLDVVGQPVLADLAAMPHLLVAGATGSGKSTLLHSLIGGLVLRNSPQDLRLVLIDRKATELVPWAVAPHVLPPVLVNMTPIQATLRWLNAEVIDKRLAALARAGARDIWAFNARCAGPQRLPLWGVVIDELADLTAVAPRYLLADLARIAALGRAVGLHLIVATQRPSVNTISGIIKANLPGRVACRLPAACDSRTVLDQGGAEHLLGAGDALFLSPGGGLQRFQGACITPSDIAAISKAWQPAP